MSNQELAEAIAVAWKCCDQTFVGSSMNKTTEAGQIYLNHLRELLKEQLARATSEMGPA